MPGAFLRLGGRILHDEPPDHLDDLVDHVHQQDAQQNGDDLLKGGVPLCQHVVRQIPDGQRGKLAQYRQDYQDKINLTFCFLGSRSNTFFHMPSFPAAFIRILPFNIPNLQPFLQRLTVSSYYRISP